MSKRTKPAKQKNVRRMPRWIGSLDYRLINRAEKDLLAFGSFLRISIVEHLFY